MIEVVKNCYFCFFLENEIGLSNNIDYCSGQTGKDNLKSFPFKKQQKCFKPDFYKILQYDTELQEIFKKEKAEINDNILNTKTYNRFRKKYLNKE